MSPPHENIQQPLSPFPSTSPTKNSTTVREQTLPPNPFALESPLSSHLPPENYSTSRSTQQSPTMNAVTFIRDHTAHDNDLPHQDECPICLDDYTGEQCLRITNIPKCSHHIGANCLDDMLRSHSHEEKRCPLCRAVWIPARPLPVLPGAQSLSASRRIADIFAGLDGIGANIANQQLGTRRGFTHDEASRQQVRGFYGELAPHPVGLHEPRPPMAEQQRTPTVIDSDSDGGADYSTHVQNFEDFRRDIADIRSRAPYRHVSRSSRRRRVADRTGNSRNGNGDANEGANSSSNSDNATATRGLGSVNTSARGATDISGTGAFNRFLNNRRTLNPFRPATGNNIVTPPALTVDAQDEHRREMEPEYERFRQDDHLSAVESSHPQELANRHRLKEERRASNQRHIPSFESPPAHRPGMSSRRATASHAHLPGPNTPENPIDINITSDKVIKLPGIQSLPVHETVRSRQLDRRGGNLDQWEQAMTMRQTRLARREVDLIARETRVDELMRAATRHREEAEELFRRHGEEIDNVLKQGEWIGKK
ncbi:hypothetical protein G6011_07760 [Alternaria panax]|uniref:RING-type domain-containing protein n=1 Tax=Alternaria panax TaxID=48097 RepID=A0AAD4I6B4_9PLEO|nr:hypothetical protein G6011_07760 [Alternaria panax]